ncbi:MAG: HTH domain-containing protein [Cyclobacteriaceae bacterium]
MTFKKVADTLGRVHGFIRIKNTGTLKELAGKLEVNRSTAFRYIETIRSYGIPIVYDRERRSYCYPQKYKITYDCGFKIEDQTHSSPK